jgi:hypothetical protein
MGTARDMRAHPTSRQHTTLTGDLSHHVGHKNAHKPVVGSKTKSDVAPMSTSEYKGHVGKYERQKNGTGRQ